MKGERRGEGRKRENSRPYPSLCHVDLIWRTGRGGRAQGAGSRSATRACGLNQAPLHLGPVFCFVLFLSLK